jgi:hypothetical protein
VSQTTKPIDDGGPAFPLEEWHFTEAAMHPDKGPHEFVGMYPGMSLRDYFAGQVCGHIEAEWSRAFVAAEAGEELAEASQVAQRSYEIADAMLAARKAGGAA